MYTNLINSGHTYLALASKATFKIDNMLGNDRTNSDPITYNELIVEAKELLGDNKSFIDD